MSNAKRFIPMLVIASFLSSCSLIDNGNQQASSPSDSTLSSETTISSTIENNDSSSSSTSSSSTSSSNTSSSSTSSSNTSSSNTSSSDSSSSDVKIPTYESPTGKTTLSPGDIHTNTGTSKKLLDTAFNGNSSERYDYKNDFQSTTVTAGETRRITFDQTIQDLEYNEGYVTPSKGKVNSLVIPVDFSDSAMKSTENRNPKNPDWFSVSAFYYNSSYGQLDMNFTILDWYTCKNESSYYETLAKGQFQGDTPGVSAIIAEALQYYSQLIDLSEYDQNKDGYIDSLYIVYNHAIDYDNGVFWWAYQYAFGECDEPQYQYDGVSAYSYMFAGYDFFFEEVAEGVPAECDTATLIHETGHMLGIEDYYDYDNETGYNQGGFACADLMHNTNGDHNPYSKMAYGWINPILVDFNSSSKSYIDVDLKAFQDSGDTIMICDNYDPKKGLFQSYFLLEYYTPTKLHEYHQIYYTAGIRLIRVNAELETTDEEGSYDYYKYNNTDTDLNFIDVICKDKTGEGLYTNAEYEDFNAADENLYFQGDSRGRKSDELIYYNTTKTNSAYSFEVISLTNSEAKIRIYKK